MKYMIYGVGGYTVVSGVYGMMPKGKAPAAAPPAAKRADLHTAVDAPHVSSDTHAAASEAPHSAGAPAQKQQVAPVLQQLQVISDRLTKIEKALGI